MCMRASVCVCVWLCVAVSLSDEGSGEQNRAAIIREGVKHVPPSLVPTQDYIEAECVMRRTWPLSQTCVV